MQDLESGRTTRSSGAVHAGSNGRTYGPQDPLDRSYLLRRNARFPFPQLKTDSETIRIRKERRVNASFSGIPPLSRNGRN